MNGEQPRSGVQLMTDFRSKRSAVRTYRSTFHVASLGCAEQQRRDIAPGGSTYISKRPAASVIDKDD
jgi:phytoene/squalene synthetase